MSTDARDARDAHDGRDARTGREAMLALEGVWKRFGGTVAVRDVSFKVPNGGVVGLIGPNGAGKSTVMNMIAGALSPDSGSVRFEGHEITNDPPYQIARRGLLRTFQASNLFPRLSVLENLLVAVPRAQGDSFRGAWLGRRYWGKAEAGSVVRARTLLEGFGLSKLENALASELSGGQKRLTEIARALMGEPRFLLLDEPISGVSPTMAAWIAERLRELAKDGLTMLVVEHEMWFVEELCDHIVVMAEGGVLVEGTMAEIRRSAEVADAYLS